DLVLVSPLVGRHTSDQSSDCGKIHAPVGKRSPLGRGQLQYKRHVDVHHGVSTDRRDGRPERSARMAKQGSANKQKREIDKHGTHRPDTEQREQRQRNDVDDMYGEVPAGSELDRRPHHGEDGQAVQEVPAQDSVQHRDVVASKGDDDQRDERADRDDGARRGNEPLETYSRGILRIHVSRNQRSRSEVSLRKRSTGGKRDRWLGQYSLSAVDREGSGCAAVHTSG